VPLMFLCFCWVFSPGLTDDPFSVCGRLSVSIFCRKRNDELRRRSQVDVNSSNRKEVRNRSSTDREWTELGAPASFADLERSSMKIKRTKFDAGVGVKMRQFQKSGLCQASVRQSISTIKASMQGLGLKRGLIATLLPTYYYHYNNNYDT